MIRSQPASAARGLHAVVCLTAIVSACADRAPTAPAVVDMVAAAPTAAIKATSLPPDAILFSQLEPKKNGVRQIFATSSNGSSQAQVTSGKGNKRWPAWSADRKKIAYVSDADGTFDLWVMNADGTGQKRLTSTGNFHERHPVFTPDGQRIIYERTSSLDVGDLSKAEARIIDVGGGNEQTMPHWTSTCEVNNPCASTVGDPGLREPTTVATSSDQWVARGSPTCTTTRCGS